MSRSNVLARRLGIETRTRDLPAAALWPFLRDDVLPSDAVQAFEVLLS